MKNVVFLRERIYFTGVLVGNLAVFIGGFAGQKPVCGQYDYFFFFGPGGILPLKAKYQKIVRRILQKRLIISGAIF